MGDDVRTFHLERMGRELKCPICWSLLTSSVSLTCNHVFCNTCILKSMKLASDCPVCKVPYTRREIRPAPHMDNMVNIYKSMENAAGISMFVTQNVPVTKLSDEENQHEGDDEMKDDGETHKNHAQNKNSFRKKESTKKIMTGTEGVDIAKPSFPAKKRIQVSQDLLSETPFKNYKFGDSLSEIDKLGTEEGLILPNERPPQNEKDDHSLSPFFWLREGEDGEKISQQSNGDQLIDCATPTPPSFSDLKDSDDESPSKNAQSDEVQKKASVNVLDNEIFEWTQRPCSPELFSSPVKMQGEDTDETDKNQENFVASAQVLEKNCTFADADNIKFKSSKVGNDLDDKLPHILASRIITLDSQNGIKKCTKRGRKARGNARKSKTVGQNAPIDGMDVDTYISLEDNQERTLDPKHNSSNMGKSNRRAKGVSFRTSGNQIPQMACTTSNMLVLSNGEVDMENNSSHQEEIEKHTPQEVAGKSKRVRSERQKLDYVHDLAEELSPTQNKTDEFSVSLSSVLIPVMEDIGNASRQSVRKSSRKSMSYNREPGSTKKLKLSSDGIIKTKNDGEIQPNAIFQQCPLMNKPVLQKCVSQMKNYQCVFCLSSEESEVSGPMVHYYDGKPVTADYEGGYKVTHSHKNCTEWAPNVYFEDDSAINLDAEISRSKRIKCCLCGLKGAALGCYAKSCRKSFHVPCAKSTSQCRWDMENFVMLCPLHHSSKLPNESSGSQERSNKNTARESKSPACKYDITVESWNARGTSNKLVLCCSALSEQERGVVSEFKKVSKVTVLKKWDSSVTHVIASTDENGACRRTLKVLLGILEGKWILNIDWIKACMKEMGPVDEGRYEINVDIHGIKDGPRLGRLRVLNEQPKLFNGYTFYFMGHFEPSYKGYLQDLVIAAGGNILHRKPVSGSADQEAMFPDMHPYQTLIIYSLELPDKCSPLKKDKILSQRLCDTDALASSTGSKVASNTWILNSIAACKLQSLAP